MVKAGGGATNGVVWKGGAMGGGQELGGQHDGEVAAGRGRQGRQVGAAKEEEEAHEFCRIHDRSK